MVFGEVRSVGVGVRVPTRLQIVAKRRAVCEVSRSKQHPRYIVYEQLAITDVADDHGVRGARRSESKSGLSHSALARQTLLSLICARLICGGFARGWLNGGVVSGVINLESPGVGAPARRPRHDQRYHG
jgi:hypothetical protein